MTRFVVRPTSCYESDGYSVVDTNREDERGKQIGRGLEQYDATHLSNMLNAIACSFSSKHTRERLLAIFAACADAHDDYLSDEERRAAEKIRNSNAEKVSRNIHTLRGAKEICDILLQPPGRRNFGHAAVLARAVTQKIDEAIGPLEEAHEKSAEQARKMTAAKSASLQEIIEESENDRGPVAVARDALMRELDTLTHGAQVADCLAVLNTIEDLIDAKLVADRAARAPKKEALGE